MAPGKRQASQEIEVAPSSTDEMYAVAEVMSERSAFTREALLSVGTFQEALALYMAQTEQEPVRASDVLGNGFSVLKNKSRLVGVPLFFLEWRFYNGEHGEFAAAMVVAEMEDGSYGKYIVNDGSSGLYTQLREITNESGRVGGLMARHGLTASTYSVDEAGRPTTDPTLAKGTATTYYIDTSV